MPLERSVLLHLAEKERYNTSMGFWQTGYMEFHDLDAGWCDGYAPSPPPLWYGRCDVCGREFSSPELLTLHSIEAHPRAEPRLCIRGQELGSTILTIRTPLRQQDVLFCNEGSVWLNGCRTNSHNVIAEICSATQRTFELQLEGSGLSRTFRVDVRIPSDADLAGVEQCVDNLVARGSLDRAGIDRFIAECRQYLSAQDYVAGVVSYFYGVLAREQSQETALEFGEHEDRFNKSANYLNDLSRPLARCLRAIIGFVGNHFTQSANCFPGSRISTAANAMVFLLSDDRGQLRRKPLQFGLRDDFRFTDFDTERLVRWSLMPSQDRHVHVAEMEFSFESMKSSLDRIKAAILIASSAHAAGKLEVARKYARHLRGSPAFGGWSERFLKQI